MYESWKKTWHTISEKRSQEILESLLGSLNQMKAWFMSLGTLVNLVFIYTQQPPFEPSYKVAYLLTKSKRPWIKPYALEMAKNVLIKQQRKQIAEMALKKHHQKMFFVHFIWYGFGINHEGHQESKSAQLDKVIDEKSGLLLWKMLPERVWRKSFFVLWIYVGDHIISGNVLVNW